MICRHKNIISPSPSSLPTRYSSLLHSSSLKQAQLYKKQAQKKHQIKRKKSIDTTCQSQSISRRSTLMVSSSVKKMLQDSTVSGSKQALLNRSRKKLTNQKYPSRVIKVSIDDMMASKLTGVQEDVVTNRKIIDNCHLQDDRLFGIHFQCNLFNKNMVYKGHFNGHKKCELHS